MGKSLLTAAIFFLTLLCIADLSARLAALVFTAIAVLFWLQQRNPESPVPPITYILLAYLLSFPLVIALPGLYQKLWVKISPFTIEYAIVWALRGFAGFIGGYLLIDLWLKRSARQQLVDSQTYSTAENLEYATYVLQTIGILSLLAWLLLVKLFGIALVFIENENAGLADSQGTVLQVLTFLTQLRPAFFFGFLLLYFRKKAGRLLQGIFLCLVLVSVVEIIAIGSKESIIRLLLIVLLSFSFIFQKITLKQVLVALLSVVLIYESFAIITEYRAIMYQKYRTGQDVFDFSVQVESFSAAFLASLPFSESATRRQTQVGEKIIFGRFSSGMYSLAHLLQITGRRSPYEYAWETLLIPLYSITPRAVLPDKPVFFDSGRNAKDYHRWAFGGVSVTLLGSLYFSWGYAGIVLGMLFTGALVAYLVRRVQERGEYAPHWLVLLVVIIVPLTDVGGTFHSLFTNCIRTAVLLGLLAAAYPVYRGLRRQPDADIRCLLQQKGNF